MKTKLAALAGALSGCFILAIGGGEAPAWLRCILVLFFGGLSLLYGYTSFVPGCPRILTSPPVIGVVCIWAGAGVMLVPPQAVLSCVLIGFGTRMLMIEHKKLEAKADERGTGTALARNSERWGELERDEVSQPPAHRTKD